MYSCIQKIRILDCYVRSDFTFNRFIHLKSTLVCPRCNGPRAGNESEWLDYQGQKKKCVEYSCGTILEIKRKGSIYKGNFIYKCQMQ